MMERSDETSDSAAIAAWRKAERERLIAARLDLPAATRTAHSAAIGEALLDHLGAIGSKAISFYWPFRGEPDLRPTMDALNDAGATCLLPVVVAKDAPLSFRAWRRGEPLSRGVWNIPYPENGPDRRPDIVIAPLVGFDADCFRLGYGGGFFDRTLAALSMLPLVVGVGYGQQKIASIRPQSHDIPMDRIITEAGALTRRGRND
jgi:5,10-methenyltetrahydrofolate synthetase